MTTEKAELLIREARAAGRLAHPTPALVRDYVAEAHILAEGRQDSIAIETGHLRALFAIIKQRDETIRQFMYPVREG